MLKLNNENFVIRLSALKTQAHLLELALLAPESEVTFECKASLSEAAGNIASEAALLLSNCQSGTILNPSSPQLKDEWRLSLDQQRLELTPVEFDRFVQKFYSLAPELFASEKGAS